MPCPLTPTRLCELYLIPPLVAITGTHIVAKKSGVAGIGNIVVHPDYRRRGLGGLVCHAVTEAVLNDRYNLVVLNVRQDNQPALTIYHHLGYWRVATYIEGYAERY